MMTDHDDLRWRRPSVYSTYKSMRDDYRNNRKGGIPGHTSWTTENAAGTVLMKHAILREPQDMLWLPPQLCAPGVVNVQRRRNGSFPMRMRFLISTDEAVRDLPLSLRVGVDGDLSEATPIAEAEGLHAMDIPLIGPGQSAWVGLRAEEEIPHSVRKWARTAIFSIDSQRL
jgi:hypothetical protein